MAEKDLNNVQPLSQDAPNDAIKRYLKRHPLTLNPFEVCTFFEDERNVPEADFELPIPKIIEKYTVIREKPELIEELEKISLLMVPLIRHLSMSTITSLVREISTLPDALQFLPDFPPQPPTNILDHFTNTLSEEQKDLNKDERTKLFNEMSKSTTSLISLLSGWKSEVVSFISGLDKYVKDHSEVLSEQQKERIQLYAERSRATVPLLEKRIQEKVSIADEEQGTWRNFFEVMKNDSRFSKMSETEKRKKVRELFDTTDENIRRMIADKNSLATPLKKTTPKNPRKSVQPSKAQPSEAKSQPASNRRTKSVVDANAKSVDMKEDQPTPSNLTPNSAAKLLSEGAVINKNKEEHKGQKKNSETHTEKQNKPTATNRKRGMSSSSEKIVQETVAGNENRTPEVASAKRVRKKPKKLQDENDWEMSPAPQISATPQRE